MEPIDLFALARSNDSSLEERFEDIAQTAGRPLAQFIRLVQDTSLVSVNLRLTVILEFLDTGRHLNIDDCRH